MKRLFGYIRVSTTRQAEKGVSLTEQRAAIEAYAVKHGFTIVGWYEEHITAAKRGRPIFTAMLAALRKGKAEGIIIHKIDRSARNLGDWADLGDLIDAGFDIHLAHEPLDLRSRGGRLSADILAVVAADFVRNNRQEARKGFYGRLKQGIYPLGAPIGYLDRGKGGKVKAVDPERAPLLRYAFERYASGEVSLLDLLEDLTARGLRNRKDKLLGLTGLIQILRNPFYAGVIRLLKTGEIFPAVHEPIIRMQTFRRVQEVLDGKKRRRVQVHDYLYRRLFACATCGRSLIGSAAKGRVYYRCPVPTCPTTCVREDLLDEAIRRTFEAIGVPEPELVRIQQEIENASAQAVETSEASRTQLTSQLGAIASRLERLTDVYVEGRIEKGAYDERRSALIVERHLVTDSLANLAADQTKRASIATEYVELARSPKTLYESASTAEKRRLVEIMTSNRTVSGKNVVIAVAEPFCFLSSAHENTPGAHQTHTSRTFRSARRISRALWEWVQTDAALALAERFFSPERDDDEVPTFRAA
jgi:DNA invertase Pin-like site-specific DNA recombinase